MDRDTFDSTIHIYKHHMPFRRFTAVMVSGDKLELDYGEDLAVRAGVAMFVSPGGVPMVLDHEGVSHFIGDPASQASGGES